jgi:hypothetical protein
MPEPTWTPPRRPSPEGRARPPTIFQPNIQNRRYDFVRRQSSRSPQPNEISNYLRGNYKGRPLSRSPPRLQLQEQNNHREQIQSPISDQNIDQHLVQRAWRGRSLSSSSESDSPLPPLRIHGIRPITPPRALTPPLL